MRYLILILVLLAPSLSALGIYQPPDPKEGVSYRHQLKVDGGVAPYLFTHGTGIPHWLTLSDSGLLEGRQYIVGPYGPFWVYVEDSLGSTGSLLLTLYVQPYDPPNDSSSGNCSADGRGQTSAWLLVVLFLMGGAKCLSTRKSCSMGSATRILNQPT